ncbi:hypothetical protein [Roseibium alexandrii]|uniref:hypothetical protein n=1 Tax=Roseibium alexandrii TaxID=388408 RepID=UPI000ACA6498|nr:hypothetical protein [Roseibium alexandrii]
MQTKARLGPGLGVQMFGKVLGHLGGLVSNPLRSNTGRDATSVCAVFLQPFADPGAVE